MKIESEQKTLVRQLAGKISQMTEQQRLEMAQKMPVLTIEGHPLSPFNACLVASQKPDVTIVGGFKQWITHGRCVAKGQHGLGIWIPCKPKKGSQDEEKVFFTFGNVFDISQTIELPAKEA